MAFRQVVGLWIGRFRFDFMFALTVCSPFDCKEVKDVFGRLGVSVMVDLACKKTLSAMGVGSLIWRMPTYIDADLDIQYGD